jgi:hypothetical protein
MSSEHETRHRQGHKANGMSRALQAAGFKLVYKGQPFAGANGKQGRYYMIRNADRWSRINDRKILAKHIALAPVRD